MQEPFDRDTELMLRCQAGDEACFEKLVERHKQRVFGLVFRFLGGRADAEDIAQEVFVRVYHARRSYTPRAKFTTWLYTICRNTCFKELRKRKHNTVSLSQETPPSGEVLADRIAQPHTASPSAALLQSERVHVVKTAIDALPEAQRMALLLRKYDQLSYQEIAKAMGCSAKAVKSLLYRAKQNLRNSLAPYVEKGESSETSSAGRDLSE